MEKKRKREREQGFDERTDRLLDELDDLKKMFDEREQLTKKMSLSGDNADDVFNQMLVDYLAGLESNSRRLEACHNGIKIFKAYIRDHNLVRASPPHAHDMQ